MLNTDAHSPQVKNRMTRDGFIKNNKGINDGTDLPEELLNDIYLGIVTDEIRMKDEIEAIGMTATGPGLAGALANVGRDLQREAYMTQSNTMANKTEVIQMNSMLERFLYSYYLGIIQKHDANSTQRISNQRTVF